MAYGLLKSSNSHDKIKSDLSDDVTKGSNNYPTTPQQTLLLFDKYSKKPTAVTQSEGTAFAQKETKKGKPKSKNADSADPKQKNLIRISTRTECVSVVARQDILRRHAQSR